ncbi:hypothetical protein [Paracoccus sp. (in: a-proteobacteria)]
MLTIIAYILIAVCLAVIIAFIWARLDDSAPYTLTAANFRDEDHDGAISK